MTQPIRIGTRKSALALWQAQWVKQLLIEHHPELHVELVLIQTMGDKILDVPLARIGGKGLFVKEIEEALLDGRADIAVHSLKDVPVEFPPGLSLTTYLEREDPRDAFLSLHYAAIKDLPPGARVGSSSLRRQSQIHTIRPDLQMIALRGNVNTRIRKLEEGEFDAIILAAAGVKRLQMTQYVHDYLDPEQIIPAVGQGVVAIETRANDPTIHALLAPLDHATTRIRVEAERAFLATLQGGCQVPIAAHATLDDDRLTLQGLVSDLPGVRIYKHQASSSPNHAKQLGEQVANILLQQGAGAILAELLTAGTHE